MYASRYEAPPMRAPSGGCVGESSPDEMDTSLHEPTPGKRFLGAQGDRNLDFFENGEHLPSAIDTEHHSYYAVCDRDKLGVRYRGSANHPADWGTVRANHPLPRRRRMFYFETTIASQGEQGSITVGLAGASFRMDRQPGTEHGSYGLDGSNGYVYTGDVRGRFFNVLSTGDTVGVGVNFKKMEAFLTHNGQLLGMAFPGIRSALQAQALYPCVGLHSPGEAVRLNFGQRPFLFDLSASVAEEDSREQAAIAAVPVCPSLLRSLVRDYLMHQGCERTLRSLGEADGEADKWNKERTASSTANSRVDATAHLDHHGISNGNSSNGTVAGGSGRVSGDAAGASRSRLPQQGADAAGPWVSTVLAWGEDREDSAAAGSRRVSEDMDVEVASQGPDNRAQSRAIDVGREERDAGEEEKRDERQGGGGLGSFEHVAAGDLLRHLQLHLGGGGFGGRASVAGSGGGRGGGTSVAAGSGQFFARQAEGMLAGARQQREEEEAEEIMDEEEGDEEPSEEDEDEEEEQSDDEEDEEEHSEDEEDEPSERDENVGGGTDEDTRGRFGAVPNSCIEREPVRPIPVSRLLAIGGVEGSVAAARAPALSATLSLRTRLRRGILAGKIDDVIELLHAERPGLLERRPDVMFALKCQAFIELVKKGELIPAVTLAQRELAPFRDSCSSRARSEVSRDEAGLPANAKGPATNGHAAEDGDGSMASSSPQEAETTGPLLRGSNASSGSRRSVLGDDSVGGITCEGVGSRKIGARSGGARASDAYDGSKVDEEIREPRNRKRRTRSYDHQKQPEDWHGSESESGSGLDRSSGPGAPSMYPARGADFSSSFCGAPSMYDTKLIAVMGLLAYEDPANSPLAHLVSVLQNQAIADKVNDAVVVAELTGPKSADLQSSTANVAPPISGLEMVVRHFLATREASREAAGDGGRAAFHPHLYF